MQSNNTRRTILAACIAAAALTTQLASLARQSARITRPVISEKTSPLEPIAPVAKDGFAGQAFLRKPPGKGPFPAVVLIHGGLTTVSTKFLRGYVESNALPSRFLAAGYVVATITYRSRDVDLQSRVSVDDSLAAVEYLQRLPYVDAASVGIFGCSGGGDLALAAAAEKPVAAIVAEEPASILFTGVFDNTFGKAGERYSPGDSAPIFADPKKYYTEKHQRRTREKIAGIRSPILIVQGDVKTPLAVNDFNAAILIPELRSAHKSIEVITYAGESHCFAMWAQSGSALKAFRDSDAFFRRYVATQPKPMDAGLITEVAITAK